MPTIEREPGYYWIIAEDHQRPIIAKWDEGLWWECGDEVPYYGSEAICVSQKLSYESGAAE